MAAEGKEEKTSEIAPEGLLLDLIAKRYPYIPKERLQKWSKVLSTHDLVFVVDLLDLPIEALRDNRPRLSIKLYGTLLEIKTKLPIIKLIFPAKEKCRGIFVCINY